MSGDGFGAGVPPADRLAPRNVRPPALTCRRRPNLHQRVSRLLPPSAVRRPNARVSCHCQYTIPSRLASNKRSSTPAARMRWRCRIRSLRIERARSAVAGSPLISAPAARARPLTRRHRPRARAPQRPPVHQVGAGTAKTSFVASPSPLPRRVEHKVCALGGRCRTGRRARLQDGFRGVRAGPAKRKKGRPPYERRLAGDRRGFSEHRSSTLDTPGSLAAQPPGVVRVLVETRRRSCSARRLAACRGHWVDLGVHDRHAARDREQLLLAETVR